jgi:hypothetical protein
MFNLSLVLVTLGFVVLKGMEKPLSHGVDRMFAQKHVYLTLSS